VAHQTLLVIRADRTNQYRSAIAQDFRDEIMCRFVHDVDAPCTGPLRFSIQSINVFTATRWFDRANGPESSPTANVASGNPIRSILRPTNTLTPREGEVFLLITAGLLNKQVGAELGATERTLKLYRARVMNKMHAGCPFACR
jgi:hypothetical protein